MSAFYFNLTSLLDHSSVQLSGDVYSNNITLNCQKLRATRDIFGLIQNSPYLDRKEIIGPA